MGNITSPRPARIDRGDRLKRRLALSSLVFLGLLQAPAAAQPRTTKFYNVIDYGAKGDGTTDSTPGIRAAISAAEVTGGTVYFPAGHYILDWVNPTGGGSLQVQGTTAITLQGAGRDSTLISERVVAQGLLGIQTDGTVVEDLTLDSLSSNANIALFDNANHTTIQRCKLLGGTNAFVVWFAGGNGATPSNPSYSQGNKVLDTIISDQVVDDGFSFSYQANALVENVDHTGSRLALYIDSHVTVNNYTYHPGIQTTDKDGFWITPPSDHVTIDNFVTYGSGGKLGNNNDRSSSNITISGEKFMSAGFQLHVGNVNGLSIDNCDYGTTNVLVFNPSVAASGIVVANCPSLAAVRFSHPAPATVSAQFNGDTYPAYHPVVGNMTETFADPYGGTTSFSVTNGTWYNRAGGFFIGRATKYHVTDLEGYP